MNSVIENKKGNPYSQKDSPFLFSIDIKTLCQPNMYRIYNQNQITYQFFEIEPSTI